MKTNPKQLIITAFEILESATTLDQVDGILDGLNISVKNRMNPVKYPRLSFKISASEIENLKESGIIDEDNTIIGAPEDPFAKLLYAVVWKNGDLPKLQHVIEGILDRGGSDERSKGVIFYQFGKFLGHAEEPIVDQHVLRAFAVYNAVQSGKDIKKYLHLKTVTRQHAGLISKYKSWLKTGLTVSLRQEPDYSFHVDQVLFALGKNIKFRSL